MRLEDYLSASFAINILVVYIHSFNNIKPAPKRGSFQKRNFKPFQ